MLDEQKSDTEFMPIPPVGADWYVLFPLAKGQDTRIFSTPWGLAAVRIL